MLSQGITHKQSLFACLRNLMPHSWLAVLATVFSGLCLTAASINAVANPKSLRLGAPPSEIDTFITERILSEAYKTLGLTLSLEALPSARSLRSSNAGVLDGEIFRIEGLEKLYPNLIRIQVPIGSVRLVAVSSNELGTNLMENLQNRRVGIIKGVVIVDRIVNAYHLEEKSQLIEVTRIRQLITLLKADKVDVIIVNYKALDILSTEDIHKTYFHYEIDETEPTFHYLHKKHQALVPQIEKVLKDMQASGKIAAIASNAISEFMTNAMLYSEITQ